MNASEIPACEALSQSYLVLDIINGLFTIVVITFGLIGNVFSIIMVTQFRISKVLLYYLVSLALWDSALLVCTCGYYSLQTLLSSMSIRIPQLLYGSLVFHGPNHIAMTCSVWMVIIITAARYFAVSDPLKHKRTFSPRCARMICGVVSVVSLIYNCPTFFELYMKPCQLQKDHHNITQVFVTYAIDGTDLRRNHFYILIFRVVMNMMFVSLVPFVVIAALTLRLIILIKRSSIEMSHMKQQRGTTTTSATERHISVMLVVLLIKFLVCYTLPTIANIWELINAQARSAIAFVVLADVGNLLVVINSATNFLVYFRWRHNLRRNSLNRKKTAETCESEFVVQHSTTTERQRLLTPNTPLLPANHSLPFTVQEAQILQNRWRQANSGGGTPISIHVLTLMVADNPAHCRALGLTEDVFSAHIIKHDPIFIVHAKLMQNFIDEFINDIFTLSGRQTIKRGSVDVRLRSFQVGVIHAEANVTLNNDVFVSFKRHMLQHVFDTELTYEQLCDSEHVDAHQATIWNRLLSMIISDIKRGYNSRRTLTRSRMNSGKTDS